MNWTRRPGPCSEAILYYAADHEDHLQLKTTADLIKYALTHGIVNA